MQDWSEIYFIPTRYVPQLAVSFHSVFELAERPTVTIVWQLWTFMVKTLGRVAWQKQLLKIYNITTNILKWIIFHFLYSFQNSDKPTRHKLSNETFYDKLRKTKILNICLSDEIWLHGMISLSSAPSFNVWGIHSRNDGFPNWARYFEQVLQKSSWVLKWNFITGLMVILVPFKSIQLRLSLWLKEERKKTLRENECLRTMAEIRET